MTDEQKKQQEASYPYINRRVSASFLLLNMANTWIIEAEEEAAKFGGFKFLLKQNIEKAKKGLDGYLSILRHQADHQGKQMDFFKDYEEMEKVLTKFIDIDNSQEQKPVEVPAEKAIIIPELHYIAKARVGECIRKSTNETRFYLEFKAKGSRFFNGYSTDTFETKLEARLALDKHNSGLDPYEVVADHTDGKSFLCKRFNK